MATRFLENHGMKTKKRTKANPEDDNKFDRALLDSSKAYLLDDGMEFSDLNRNDHINRENSVGLDWIIYAYSRRRCFGKSDTIFGTQESPWMGENNS